MSTKSLEACQECAAACDACLIKMAGMASDNDCPKCCAQCAAICKLCATLIAMDSDYAAKACALCAEVCDWCASQCGEHDHEHCQKCAKSCKTCAEECRALAA